MAEIRIEKSARRLVLVGADGAQRSFAVTLGHNAAADKRVEGDGATPLGEFYVCARNPRSRYFLSLCLSYPTAAHAARGLETGLITAAEHAAILAALAAGRMPPQKTRLGGEIYIHGEVPRDWTHGCIALDNAAMREVYDGAPLGTRVTIAP